MWSEDVTVDGSTHVYHRVVATHREHAGLEPTFKVHARRAAAAAALRATARVPVARRGCSYYRAARGGRSSCTVLAIRIRPDSNTR